MGSESASFSERHLLVRAAAWPLYVAVWSAVYAFCVVLLAMVAAVAWGSAEWPAGSRVDGMFARVVAEARQLERAAFPRDAPRLALAAARELHAWVVIRSGLARRLADPPSDSVSEAVTREFGRASEIWQLAGLGMYFLGVRCVCVLALTPLVAAAWMLGLVDGLAARSVRRACAGRESAGLYHRAKWWQLVLGAGGVTAYLIVPLPAPLQILAPITGIATLILSRTQWKYYKKYR
ncbi:MAG: DUF4400 domain-containing protein [Rhodocyclaceae bacterium]|nr:DUF4400 domain-containing protein [Rhodocyclaceae bacterium]